MEPHILKILMIVLVMGVFAYLVKHLIVLFILGPEDHTKGFSQSQCNIGFRNTVTQKKSKKPLTQNISQDDSIFHGVQNGEPDIAGIWTVDED